MVFGHQPGNTSVLSPPAVLERQELSSAESVETRIREADSPEESLCLSGLPGQTEFTSAASELCEMLDLAVLCGFMNRDFLESHFKES
jgi:hypothetical protein